MTKLFIRWLFLMVLSIGGASTNERMSEGHPAAPGLITGTVVRVIDGDTVVVRIKSVSGTLPRDVRTLRSEETVRYIGVNTPELGHNGQAPDCFATRAKAQNEFLTLNKDVTLQLDIEGRDRYSRLLAYVFLGDISKDELVEDRLVNGGFGWVIAIAPNVWHTKRLLELEREAVRKQEGLWAACEPVPDIESLTISEIQYVGDDETLTLINRGSKKFDLSRWKLVSLPGQIFDFPDGCTLAMDSRLRIHSGPKADRTATDCSRGELFWTASLIWNNDGDTAILQTPQGIVADFFEYKGGHASTHAGH